MLRTIINQAIDMWNDGILEKSIMILVALCIFLLAYLLWMFFYWVIDFWLVPVAEGTAVVSGRRFIPAHITYTYMSTGKTTTMMPIYHPDEWRLIMKMNDGRSDSIGVSRNDYERIKDGIPCVITYKNGRLSKDIYIKSWRIL